MNKSSDCVGNGQTTAAVAAAVVVAVAVKSGRGGGSRRAFKWAVEKFMGNENHFVLVHVIPTVTVIPTPCNHSLYSSPPFSHAECFLILILGFFSLILKKNKVTFNLLRKEEVVRVDENLKLLMQNSHVKNQCII